MYKDIISYQLAEGISEAHLLTVAQDIVNNWMKNLPGFIRWEIHSNQNGGHTDIVYWENKESAKNAEKELANIPNAADWQACYAPGSINFFNLEQVAGF